MSHSDLVMIAYKWVLKNGSCGFAFREMKALCDEIPDVIGFGSGGHSVLIECKVSRSDFLCDKGKPFRLNPMLGMGRHRAYCCPEGLIKPEELPTGWGLIYVNEKGKARMVVSMYDGNIVSKYIGHERSIKNEMALMYSALRRLNLRGHIESIYEQPWIESAKPKPNE